MSKNDMPTETPTPTATLDPHPHNFNCGDSLGNNPKPRWSQPPTPFGRWHQAHWKRLPRLAAAHATLELNQRATVKLVPSVRRKAALLRSAIQSSDQSIIFPVLNFQGTTSCLPRSTLVPDGNHASGNSICIQETRMRTQIVTAAIIGFVTASAAFAQAPTGPMAQAGKSMGNRPECTANFRALDKNADGKLDDREIAVAALPSNVLRQPNGQISEVDFVSACSSQMPLGQSGQ